MKSKDTLKWFPAQLPEVRIILGDAVVEVAKQGRPINTRTLLDYIEGNIKKKSWLDNKELLQTASPRIILTSGSCAGNHFRV
ncbi:hypothetical protein, partial [Escherichia coli]|uniref:hypothetical protein n=1 Tax=Escherichia coli TaxID=562 RepID=UPI0030C72088